MAQRSVDAEIYDEQYYLNTCLGSEEFKESGGKRLHPRLENLLGGLNIGSSTRLLDVGCGRGDITLFLAKDAKEAFGIDYSKSAISLANKTKKTFDAKVQKKVSFSLMNVKELEFPDDYFDLIICIDVLEHLYKPEAEEAMWEMKRVLKPDGILFVHTGTNRLLYDYTYKYYIFPMNTFLASIDQFFKSIQYDALPKDPRTITEKKQHVNEPTYFYLKNLFARNGFSGKIHVEIGYIKSVKNLKTIVYNALIALYPISLIFPLNTIFGWIFIAKLKKR